MTAFGPRPSVGRAFYKGHGLGNDYLVFEEGDAWSADDASVASVCHPHRGVGSDGIVVLLGDRSDDVYRLRMFNPDGSEFERSGNGLRVFASFLARRGDRAPYVVEVGGGRVVMDVHGEGADGWDVSVEIGAARSTPEAVGLDPRALDAEGRLPGPDGAALDVVPVSVGNPHAVVLGEEITEARLAEVGPFLVAHPAFAAGTNVQLAEAEGPGAARALVWERGVGRTAASGTSACAVAVALVVRGRLAPGAITVRMPGGAMGVRVDEALDVTLRAPAAPVCDGVIAGSLVARAAS